MRPAQIRRVLAQRPAITLDAVREHMAPSRLAALRHPVWSLGAVAAKPQLRSEARRHDVLYVRGSWRAGAWRTRLRAFARIWWTAFWEAAHPCCLGYRYGHGWTRYITQRQGEKVPELGILVGHRHVGPGTSALDLSEVPGGGPVYAVPQVEAIIAMGPAPCPTCGHQPPRALVRAWELEARRA
jgi:hypothetical protein